MLQVKQTKQASSPTKVIHKSDESESEYSESDEEQVQSSSLRKFKLNEYGRKLHLTEPVFSEEEAAMIIKNILIGLQQVHQQNLLHRDIKPENIVLGGKKRPDPTSQEITEAITELRIIDFGFSSETKRSKWDQLESNVGTTLFMAPE